MWDFGMPGNCLFFWVTDFCLPWSDGDQSPRDKTAVHGCKPVHLHVSQCQEHKWSGAITLFSLQQNPHLMSSVLPNLFCVFQVFHNCSCLQINSSWSGNTSATLGQCPKSNDCSMNFIYYTVIQVIGGFCYALGATASYMLIFRWVQLAVCQRLSSEAFKVMFVSLP